MCFDVYDNDRKRHGTIVLHRATEVSTLNSFSLLEIGQTSRRLIWLMLMLSEYAHESQEGCATFSTHPPRYKGRGTFELCYPLSRLKVTKRLYFRKCCRITQVHLCWTMVASTVGTRLTKHNRDPCEIFVISFRRSRELSYWEASQIYICSDFVSMTPMD